ncbi:hypothetical protein CW304_11965 [Bacillus sp. UFRGS-B20]|nr:hypothetical protein CW304_11965 [Bacillus sp. UFRGS-B20]
MLHCVNKKCSVDVSFFLSFASILERPIPFVFRYTHALGLCRSHMTYGFLIFSTIAFRGYLDNNGYARVV